MCGTNDELRTVLVSIHAPGRKPDPIPPELPGWDKYEMRCCRFQSETLAEAAVNELLAKIPEGPAREIAKGSHVFQRRSQTRDSAADHIDAALRLRHRPHREKNCSCYSRCRWYRDRRCRQS